MALFTWEIFIDTPDPWGRAKASAGFLPFLVSFKTPKQFNSYKIPKSDINVTRSESFDIDSNHDYIMYFCNSDKILLALDVLYYLRN